MVIEILVNWVTQLIASLSYPGVFLLMMLESTAAPVPSEAVLPFAGFLVAQGGMDFWLAAMTATLGSIAGSLISYWIGFKGGRPLVNKVGRYLLLHERHLNHTENFFQRYGSITVFVARFVPVVRHLISIPAGVAEMKLKRFVPLTIAGASIWNTFLLWVGITLREQWSTILQYTQMLDVLMITVIVLGGVWWMMKIRKHSHLARHAPVPEKL